MVSPAPYLVTGITRPVVSFRQFKGYNQTLPLPLNALAERGLCPALTAPGTPIGLGVDGVTVEFVWYACKTNVSVAYGRLHLHLANKEGHFHISL